MQGKTTLLSALAGQMPYSKNIHLQVRAPCPGARTQQGIVRGQGGGAAKCRQLWLPVCPLASTSPQGLPALHTHLSQGHITTNGVPLSSCKLRAGFVQQDDLFYPQARSKGWRAQRMVEGQ